MNEPLPPMGPVGESGIEPRRRKRNFWWDAVICLFGVGLAVMWMLGSFDWPWKVAVTVIVVIAVVVGERLFGTRSVKRKV